MEQGEREEAKQKIYIYLFLVAWHLLLLVRHLLLLAWHLFLVIYFNPPSGPDCNGKFLGENLELVCPCPHFVPKNGTRQGKVEKSGGVPSDQTKKLLVARTLLVGTKSY